MWFDVIPYIFQGHDELDIILSRQSNNTLLHINTVRKRWQNNLPEQCQLEDAQSFQKTDSEVLKKLKTS